MNHPEVTLHDMKGMFLSSGESHTNGRYYYGHDPRPIYMEKWPKGDTSPGV